MEQQKNYKRLNVFRYSLLSAVALCVLSAKLASVYIDNKKAQRTLAYNYTKAIGQLADCSENISTDLKKQLYSSTAEYSDKMATRLKSEASQAKSALEQLPLDYSQTRNVEKFLSQVGNFATSASAKRTSNVYTDSYDIDAQDYTTYDFSTDDLATLKKLYDISCDINQTVEKIREGVSTGVIDIAQLGDILEKKQIPTVTNAWIDQEENADYPKLVYDGAFSDNVSHKTPELTKDLKEVSESAAIAKAASCLKINSAELKITGTTQTHIPCYNINDKQEGNVSCSVSKKGGLLVEFMKYRDIGSAKISIDKALEYSDAFLQEMNISSMERNYYERYGDTLLVNYVYRQNDTLVYPDMIKISIALDNGEIISYDAQSYITNHKQRKLSEVKCDYMDALELVSDKLEVVSRRMAVIPSEGTSEKFCHEFICKTKEGGRIIVYINALTGKEEQILILTDNENGTMAR